MEPKHLDFEGLARELINRARELLPSWLPGGRVVGQEYCCGNLRGEHGDSLRVNVNTGRWAEFNGTERGGDLISLYAAINNIGQGEAAKQLSSDYNYPISSTTNLPTPQPKVSREILKPPSDATEPTMEHGRYGVPSKTWAYRDAHGETLFHVARYDTTDGKQILPWSWDGKQWVTKGWPAPRPLYGLHDLAERPDAPVLICEGEKAAEAARYIAGRVYNVVTWPNGAQAVTKADWTPVYGRKVLVWPDADEPGIHAAHEIARILTLNGCPEVKIIDPNGQPDHWDAADALADGWDWATLRDWARPRVQVFSASAQAVVNDSEGKTVAAAQANVQVNVSTEVIDPASMSHLALWERIGIAQTGAGQPICKEDNVLRVIEALPQFNGMVWYDEFYRRYFTNDTTGPREWRDIDDLNFMLFLQRDVGFCRMSAETVNSGIRLYGHQHKRNEPRDWMDGLTWDGIPRVESFLIDCAGAVDNEYTRAVSRNFWVSMIARVYRPGCKVDNMIILEGGQGKFKSTLLGTIGGAWHTESTEEIGTKDFFQSLNGKLIVEFADLSSWPKADVDTLKKTITCRVDRYRASYARSSEDFPRQSIFAGTTNESIYLRDDTGGRRFWPIATSNIDIERTKDTREQLFAEAVHLFKHDTSWWEVPGSAVEEQEARRMSDEWEQIVGEYLIGKYETTIRDIATDALKVEVARLDKGTQMRIARILKVVGWERQTQRRGGKPTKLWISCDHLGGNEPDEW